MTIEQLILKIRLAAGTTLDLSFNNLGSKSGAELAQAFAAIPASVTTLNLTLNNLDFKSGAELAQAFAAIPPTVTTLDLTDNILGFGSDAELVQALAAIPPTVTTINLSGNLLNEKSSDELRLILSALPIGVKIQIDINTQPFIEHELLRVVAEHVDLRDMVFADNLLPPVYKESEDLSNSLIAALRNYNSPIASLTAALLLNYDGCMCIKGLHENTKDIVEATNCFLDSLSDRMYLDFVRTAFAFMRDWFASESKEDFNSEEIRFIDYLCKVCATIDAKSSIFSTCGYFEQAQMPVSDLTFKPGNEIQRFMKKPVVGKEQVFFWRSIHLASTTNDKWVKAVGSSNEPQGIKSKLLMRSPINS